MTKVEARFPKICTPVFTPEMGKRLAILRMRLFLTQGQLAKKLSTESIKVTQQTISAIEHGRTQYGHFLLSTFIELLGLARAEYVLLGLNASSYNEGSIKAAFFKEKLKAKFGQKKRGNPHRHLPPLPKISITGQGGSENT